MQSNFNAHNSSSSNNATAANGRPLAASSHDTPRLALALAPRPLTASQSWEELGDSNTYSQVGTYQDQDAGFKPGDIRQYHLVPQPGPWFSGRLQHPTASGAHPHGVSQAQGSNDGGPGA